MSASFYFYDLETSGISPRESRIMQFAGQRVDMDLQPMGEPHNYLLRLSEDILPEPEAIMLTGITPQQANAEGITEAQFLKYFYQEIATTETIFVGFNTVRFDDEFMRFLHYRNFYDPYEWQWQDKRSRWDMLDVVRMTRALRPEGINWPVDANGKPTNRLELLTSRNNLDHSHAHDALNDVYATIAVARLIKQKQPKLFDYLFQARDKKKITQLVNAGQPFVYTSGKYSSAFEHTTAVTMLAQHPKKQGALVYDLRYDPTPFLNMKAAELVEAWQWIKDAKEPRLPVKTMQFNRCPAVAPLTVLDQSSWQRIKLDQSTVHTNLQLLHDADGFVERIFQALKIMDDAQQLRFMEDQADVDNRLYEGFMPEEDKRKMQLVREIEPEELTSADIIFKDDRLRALLPLYKARNYPNALTTDELAEWEKWRELKLLAGGKKSRLGRYFKHLGELAEKPNLTAKQQYILEELQLYAQSIMPADYDQV